MWFLPWLAKLQTFCCPGLRVLGLLWLQLGSGWFDSCRNNTCGLSSFSFSYDPQWHCPGQGRSQQVTHSSPGTELRLGEAFVPLCGFRWEPLRGKQGLCQTKTQTKVALSGRSKRKKSLSWSSYCFQQRLQCAYCYPLLFSPTFSRKTETITLRMERDTRRVSTTP